MVQANRSQMTLWRMRIACCKVGLQTQTQNM